LQPPQSSIQSPHTPPNVRHPEKTEQSLGDHAGHASDSVTLRDGQDTINSLNDAPALEVAASSPSTPNSEQSAGWSDVHNEIPIPVDPVILADDRFWVIGELQPVYPEDSLVVSETNCPYPDPPAVLCDTSVYHPDSDARPTRLDSNPRSVSPHGQGHTQHPVSHDNAEADVLPCGSPLEASTSGKQSKPRKRKPRTLDGQLSKRIRGPMSGPKEDSSFLALRAHFLSLSNDERLQFLSWLFEGALPRCLPGLDSKMSKDKDERPARDVDHPSRFRGQHGTSRKGKPWSSEEVNLLLKLRRDEGRPWSEVAKLFSDRYPGRSPGSIQVFWSSTLKAGHFDGRPDL
ncbi:hypothetical protein AnigIFM59636_002193, partial [Aspergillus niger]